MYLNLLDQMRLPAGKLHQRIYAETVGREEKEIPWQAEWISLSMQVRKVF